MGWWKVEGTEHVVGDGPLDTLGGAVADLVADYQSALKRRLTRAEWEALLLAVRGSGEPDARVSDEGIAREISVKMW